MVPYTAVRYPTLAEAALLLRPPRLAEAKTQWRPTTTTTTTTTTSQHRNRPALLQLCSDPSITLLDGATFRFFAQKLTIKQGNGWVAILLLIPTTTPPYLVRTFRKITIFAVNSDDYPPLLGEHIS